MNDNFELHGCSEDDALEFSSGLYRIKKIKRIISYVFRKHLGQKMYELLKSEKIDITPLNKSQKSDPINWFNDGIDCEILRVGGKSWEKGRLMLNISLEFIPDEVENLESPLDDVRQEINQN